MENAHSGNIFQWVETEPDIYKKVRVIWLRFSNDIKKVAILRKRTKLCWSKSQKCWFVADNKRNREIFEIEKTIVGKNSMARMSEHNSKELVKLKETLILKGFSENTIRTYCNEFAQLLHKIGNFQVENLSTEKLRSYLLHCHTELKMSENQIHSRMNALKFYFEKVLHRERIFFEIPRPKKPLKLPKALNQEEIRKIIEITENKKHKLIIQLCYGMGLRVSEIVNLKIEDVDGYAKTVFIENAKGKKDRYVNLPISILEELRIYYKEFRPKKYLFEGENQMQYSIRSAQQVFKNAMRKAGIQKTVGIHSLRHSYATHLLEYGTDIRIIKDLMGHQNIKTTEIYAAVTDVKKQKLKSPLDLL